MTTTDDEGDPIGYADALVELEEILGRLEDDDIDIDVLADQVGRAARLIRVCRERIAAAEMRVTEIVADLEQLATDSDDRGGGATPDR